jgi:hypothetical protein
LQMAIAILAIHRSESKRPASFSTDGSFRSFSPSGVNETTGCLPFAPSQPIDGKTKMEILGPAACQNGDNFHPCFEQTCLTMRQ